MTVQLPVGWASVTPADVATDVPYALAIGPFGSNLKVSDYTNDGVPLVFVRHIRAERFDGNDSPCVSLAKAKELAAHWVHGGDVLVTKMGEPPGDSALYPPHLQAAVITADCLKWSVDSRVGNAKFFMYILRSPAIRRHLQSITQGVAQRKISLGRFKTVQFPCPPVREQGRIVEALESHLSRLDAAVESLEAAKRKLMAYRASVLKAAVEGRLVPTEAELARKDGRLYESADVLLERILEERRRHWEDAELAKMKAAGKTQKDDRWKSKYQEPALPDSSKLPGLPQGWCWATLDQLSVLVRNGHPAPPRESAGVRTLRISAVRPLAVDFEDVRYLPGRPEDFADDLVDVDDLLFTRYNGTPSLVGVCGRVRFLDRPTVHPDKLIKIRLVTPASSPFIEIATNTGNSRRHVESRTRTTAGQAGISGADLKQMPVPLPPREEQERIWSTVEALMTVEATTRRDLDLSLRRCAALRRAFLKAAFEGTLVDQRPDDEPADVLLARIRAERESAPVTKSKVKRPRKLKAAS